jgi:hypothetical protein
MLPGLPRLPRGWRRRVLWTPTNRMLRAWRIHAMSSKNLRWRRACCFRRVGPGVEEAPLDVVAIVASGRPDMTVHRDDRGLRHRLPFPHAVRVRGHDVSALIGREPGLNMTRRPARLQSFYASRMQQRANCNGPVMPGCHARRSDSAPRLPFTPQGGADRSDPPGGTVAAPLRRGCCASTGRSRPPELHGLPEGSRPGGPHLSSGRLRANLSNIGVSSTGGDRCERLS